MSVLFAATYPERTAALVLCGGVSAHDVGARLAVGQDGGGSTARTWRPPDSTSRATKATAARSRRSGRDEAD